MIETIDTVVAVKELLYRMGPADQAVMLACAQLLNARRRGTLSAQPDGEMQHLGAWHMWLTWVDNLPEGRSGE